MFSAFSLPKPATTFSPLLEFDSSNSDRIAENLLGFGGVVSHEYDIEKEQRTETHFQFAKRYTPFACL